VGERAGGGRIQKVAQNRARCCATLVTAGAAQQQKK